MRLLYGYTARNNRARCTSHPLDVVYGEVNLHALTGDGLDISVGNAKVVSLPLLGVLELGAETGILNPTEKTS